MFRFTIRDVLWLTAVVAIALGWWVDRSALAWRYSQSVMTMDRLRERLDIADPEWHRKANAPRIPNRFDRPARAKVGYLIGAGLFALAAFAIISAWRGGVFAFIIERRW